MTMRAIRWWPPLGVAGMLLLGLAVGKGSTPVDDRFQRHRHGPFRWLEFFADPRVLAIVLAAVVAVALYRRQWRLAVLAVVSPFVAVVCVAVVKPLFDRKIRGGLSYPSGHTAVMVVVMGFLVLVAGAALWAVLVAIVFCGLGALGLAVTYHYFTDTVGAMLLGTAIVCAAALALGHGSHRHRPHRT
jgi:membrane-associated phospholipid phosphatase